MLRALRAAEMASWEAAHPSTLAEPAAAGLKVRPLFKFPGRPSGPTESWMFLTIALCAAVALVIGFNDVSALLAGWSRMAEGIHLLLQ
jgi:hypothetical protein